MKIADGANSDDCAQMRDQYEKLKDLSYPAAWLQRREIAALEPHLKLPETAEALFTMSDYCLDAPAFTRFIHIFPV